MNAFCRLFVLLLASVGLASCGGGGNGTNSAFGGAPNITVAVSASPGSIPVNSFTTLTVTAKNPDGSNGPDGAGITVTLSPPTLGTLSPASGGPSGSSASAALSGGIATFYFNTSNQPGTAHIIASATVITTGTVHGTFTYTGSTDVAVSGANSQDPRLTLTASTTTLPQNPFIGLAEIGPAFVSNYIGSPWIAEVTVTWRHSNGSLVSGTLPVNVSIDPVSIAGFSQLDDPNTPQNDPNKPDGNEFLIIEGSGPVNVTAGNGVIFVHAFDTPGTTTLTVTAVDPDTNQTISSQMLFTVAGAASTLPTSVEAFGQGAAYIASSGGPQSTVVEAIVTDGNDALIPDPNGFDTVHFEIVGPAGNDARLTGINAAGQSITGTAVDTVTHSGIAAVTFLAGAQQGPVQIRATADRGDGNVDNGIQDPVSSTATVVVSDGRLYGLTLTSPTSNAILINRVSNQVSTTAIPPDPDATYSFTVSAVGVDRMGNPVVPGTEIRFGSIDSPVDANQNYEISGTAGDPQEGGTLFTATDGQFTTAGGGAGPGDTLLVIGEQDEGAPAGNDNLESAAKVASIQNGQTLHTTTPFNWNDTTGISVNYGPVLPYIIGRAQTGNISSPSFTNNIGTATTTLNYPVSALGHVTAIWAQGDGVNTATHPGSTDVVTDIALAAFPGAAPAKITISPNPIPGNIDIEVDVCIVDATGAPLSGVAFQFAFSNLGIGSGSVDGISSAGTVPQVTGANGCVATDVVTNGISTGGTGTPSLSFTAGTATASANITATGNLILLANPSSFTGNGGVVTLTLLDGNGTPVPNVQIVGTCTSSNSSLGIVSGPGVTDAQGKTTATINGNMNGFGSTTATGTCTFTTSLGSSPSAIVNVNGIDQCTIGISPVPAQCTGGGTPVTSTVGLAIQSTDGNPVTASFSSNPAGASCSAVAASTTSCTATLSGGTYTLTAAITAPAAFQGWSGSCTPAGPNKATLIVPATSTSGLSCTLQVCSAGPPVGGVCP